MPIGRWIVTTAFILLATVSAGGAQAQTPGANSYTVTGVDVDTTGPDAVKAREEGIREARRRAARMLVDRMVAAEDRGRVPPLDDARLEGMVRGVEFMNERSAPGRYIGTLNVVFAAEPVKAWLGQTGAGVAETVARPALVVPLWKGRNGVEPMDDRNLWRDAWRSLDGAGGSVPVTLVRGDQSDQNAMSVEEAYVGDISALSRLNERYRAPMIIVAVVEGDKDGGNLTVGGTRYDTQTGARSEIAKMPVADATQLGAAARQVHAKVEADWRSVATVRRDSQDALDVVVPISALGDWVQIRQRLGGLPAVKNVAVKSLEANRADLRLEYFGSTDDLQRNLAQVGLNLVKDGNQWRLQAR